MRVFIRSEADRDLDSIFDWIAKDNPRAAAEVIRRIHSKIELLATTGFAGIGRQGREPGTRELVVAPYIIVYEVHKQRDELVVLGIFHGAMKRL